LQPLPRFSLRAILSRLFSPLFRPQSEFIFSSQSSAPSFPLNHKPPEKTLGKPLPPTSDSAPPLFQLKGAIPENTDLKIHASMEARGPESKKNIFKPKIQRKIENWELPKLAALEDPPSSRLKIDEKEIKRKAELLKEKMAHFSVTGEVVAARPGPAVTLFEFKPDADVKLSKITELADDLSLALASESLRIIAPIPGRDVVGIETSNHHRETVYLKDMLQEESFWRHEMKLPVSLGKQVDGKPNLVDLRRLPHLMVAGTTGSGKSVFVVSTLIGLLFKHSPQTLRLLIIDPKQVDLAAFEKLPHLILPLVTDSRQAVSALKWAVNEMEKRYRSMSEFSARGLETYNEATAALTLEEIDRHEKLNHEYDSTPGRRNDTYYFRPLPYLVVVIEEFGDLMSVDKANVEHSVVRLAQKARACGIHLILAMQSPRKEVVTGLIKTNIPGRISFKVSSTMDSRIILDETGADRLLAQGDLLFRNPGGANLLRHHAPFLKDQEVLQICNFWSQQSPPQYDEGALKSLKSLDNEGDELGEIETELDDKYDEILAWASSMKEISASLIQRRFQLGYPRAARLIESFERQGVVGPAQGSKPRTVLISSFEHLDTPSDPR
ncbi:MAG: DNA translocase FtsK, partial [Bdellovibrio sp.]